MRQLVQAEDSRQHKTVISERVCDVCQTISQNRDSWLFLMQRARVRAEEEEVRVELLRPLESAGLDTGGEGAV